MSEYSLVLSIRFLKLFLTKYLGIYYDITFEQLSICLSAHSLPLILYGLSEDILTDILKRILI